MPDDREPNDTQRPARTTTAASRQRPCSPPTRKVQKINVAEEIKNSFLDYSMSVIISRALPDVRDGLKPSQRRILYAMNDLALYPEPQAPASAPRSAATRWATTIRTATRRFIRRWSTWRSRGRCASGWWTGRGISAPWKAIRRRPCVTPRRAWLRLGAVLMEDMEKETVDFIPNYDETRTEPTVFPAAFPNLLVNGGTGIAVGMATNMPPHNLGEIIDGVCAQIDRPEITLKELMQHVKGPDFPTGCMVCGLEGVKQYFTTGRGSVKVRGQGGPRGA